MSRLARDADGAPIPNLYNPPAPVSAPHVGTCTAVYHGYGHAYTCERTVDEQGRHFGMHQQKTGGPGFNGGAVWNSGMMMGISMDAVACAQCGTYDDHIEPGAVCSMCTNHLSWITAYIAGSAFAVNGRLHQRERSTGAFGNAQITVHLDDGRTFGPDSRTWDLGEIPWEYRDLMPDNARMDWGRS